jgi:dCMP deaminase
MQVAKGHAALSKGVRAKVGAVMVTSTCILIPGYNGCPTGMSNVLEYTKDDGSLVTKPEVIHAELNCVLKAAREGVSCQGSKVYVTHSPCIQCSAMLVNAGVSEVIYGQVYRDSAGINLLASAGIFTKLLEN